MAKNGIKGMPVLDDNGRLVGMVTLTDVLKVHPDQRATTLVSSVMTKELVTTTPDETLYTAFDKMTSNQIGRLPVVEPGGQLEADRHNHARRCLASLQRRD